MKHCWDYKKKDKMRIEGIIDAISVDVMVNDIGGTKRHRKADLGITGMPDLEQLHLVYNMRPYELLPGVNIGIMNVTDKHGKLKQHKSNTVNLYCEYDDSRYKVHAIKN